MKISRSRTKGIAILLSALALLFAGCQNISGPDGGAADARALVAAPIPINNEAEFALIGADPHYPLDGEYVLTANLNLEDWIPLGPNAANAFTGSLDGLGHTITLTSFDITVVKGNVYLGIFAYVRGRAAGDAVIQNLNVNINLDPLLVASGQYFGGVASYAVNAQFTDIMISRTVSPNTFEIEGVTSALYVGGLVGYSETTVFAEITTGLPIDATAINGPVYIGGVLGYGYGVAISDSRARGGVAPIVGNGQGHNTSAGGIAGYLTSGSEVSSCFSNISVSLTADGAAGMSTLYMIYAGGLLGYQGAGSTTTHSSAHGDVYAESPYPYAGGLIGYNYGNLSGQTGSAIYRSYTDGSATVTANAQIGGLPYAGGVAGYSSGSLAIIENSYSTLNVEALTDGEYAWAGGVVGSNANNSVVNNVYAAGDVTATNGDEEIPFPQPGVIPGAFAGGIVGYNYFTTTTAITNSVGLNGAVTALYGGSILPYPGNAVAHRVAGANGDGTIIPTLQNNYGRWNMVINPGPLLTPDPSNEEGGDASQADINDYTWYRDTLGWNFTDIWQAGSPYPTLQ
jgi:hypothetical protein